MPELQAYGPNGFRITGIVHLVYAVARIAHFKAPVADTDLDPDPMVDYAGETEMDWDSQRVALDRDVKVVYEDTEGNRWYASQLTFKETP